MAGATGLRQPVNTWSNLYALFTAAWVACRMMRDRQEGSAINTMRSNSPIADACVFAVLFLGLGSMWFHASISSAVSWMDGFSMYVFSGYLGYSTRSTACSVMKGVSDAVRNLVFWVGWPVNAIIFTDLIRVAPPIGTVHRHPGRRLCPARGVHRPDRQGRLLRRLDRLAGCQGAGLLVVRIGEHLIATLPGPAGDGEPLLPNSWFQPHGLICTPSRRDGAASSISTGAAKPVA